jgi:ferritin-like metal-binding protein YciE
MADATATDAKLTQYLTEAYSKEKELETALEAHIAMTTRPPYKKRLKEHLAETKRHAKALERRVKKISGEKPDAGVVAKATAPATKAKALTKGPLHALRGTGEAEKMLKNAKTEYWNEHEEIATYTAIETLASAVKDRETAKLARSIRREEERMANFLERQITSLTKAVVQEEIPSKERRAGTAKANTNSRTSSTGSRSSSTRKTGGSRKKSSRSGAKRSGRTARSPSRT